MSDILGLVLSFIFGENSTLATFIISMFPLVELKGAIPIGCSRDIWGSFALSSEKSFIISLIGSCAVVFILPLIFTKLITLLKRSRLFSKLARAVEEKISKHASVITTNKNSTFLKMLAMFTFVAIPLPLTGVWTGACVSIAIGLSYGQTIISVTLGNIVAGLIIYFVCAIFPNFITWLIYIFLGLIISIFVIGVIRKVIKNKKSKKDIEI